MVSDLIKFWNMNILKKLGDYLSDNSKKMIYNGRYTTSDIYTCIMLCHILGQNVTPFKFNEIHGFDDAAMQDIIDNVEEIWNEIKQDE